MSPEIAPIDLFFAKTIERLGFNPEKDFGMFDPFPDDNSRKFKKPLLEKDVHGNILFNLMDIHGNIRVHDVSDARSKVNIQPVQLIRFRDPGDGPKYKPAKTGQGVYPWISREIVEAYKAKTKIKRLILTEGYKKAFVGCKKGFHVIGLPGISVWKSKEAKEIFHDIKALVTECQVEDILWLTDADTLHVHWEPNKDLYKRPFSFYNSVQLFKTLCRDWQVNLYYAHIHEESKEKGLDDLLLNENLDPEKLQRDLLKSSGQLHYIRRYDITTWSYQKIQELFGIHGDASTFYGRYERYIGLEEFIYRNGVYAYDIEKQELIYKKSGEASQFIRVMKDYYMMAQMPTASSFTKLTLIPTDKSSIQEKFKSRNKKEVERILYDIPFYDGFFNQPGHVDFQREITITSEDGHTTTWYNKYMPLTHKAILGHRIQESEIPLSLKFVKHIFGTEKVSYNGSEINEWDLGLDYLQLLYLRPKQPLPILALLSQENQTGKTIFWRWCVAIFQQNAKIIPPESLTGNFTEYFINCLLLIIDEALLNKRETMERVKAMTTNEEAMVNGKHTKEVETQTYLKIGLSSNNVNDFAILTKNDERFWIRDVPVIPEEDYIPDFFTKLCAEIPLFLGFLQQRDLVTQNEDRMWFDPELRKTAGLSRLIDKSRPANEILIEETIKDYMTGCSKPVVNLSQSDIRELSTEKNNLHLNTIKWVVEDRWNKKKNGYSRKYKKYRLIVTDSGDSPDRVDVTWAKTNYYSFSALEFFTPAQILEMFEYADILEAEIEEGFDLKSKLSGSDFYQIRYAIKQPPCELQDFIALYDSAKTLNEISAKLHEFVMGGGDMPF